MTRSTLSLILGLSLLLGLCQLLGADMLAYDRERIGHGAYGLLLTGHLVHLNAMHLLLNLLGLALVLTLFDRVLPWWQWLLVLVSSTLAISLTLYCWLPQVERYVGLSGVIHSLYAAGAVVLLAGQERKLALFLLGLLTLKLLTEGYGQGISFTAQLIGGHVLTQAHLYGAVFGLCCGAVLLTSARCRQRTADD